jgi:hypothetical protein
MPMTRIVKTMLTVSAALAMLLLPSPAGAQKGDYGSVAIKTQTGYLWVCNEANNWYTLEIQADSVTRTSTSRKVFSVDGLLLQIVTTSTNKFLGERAKQALDDKTILEAHRDWEAKDSEESYKARLTIESSWQKLTNGKDALLWKFNVPEGASSNLKKEIYLTQVKGDYVLLLGGIVTDTIKEDGTIKLLLTTASTLKVSDKPIELNQLKESIRKDVEGVNYFV